MIPWLIGLLIWLCVLGLIWWLITGFVVPLLPQPMQQVARVIVTIVFVLILIYMLIGVYPMHFPGPPPR